MGISNNRIFVGLLSILTIAGQLDEILAKCSLTPLDEQHGDKIRIAYACVNGNFSDVEEIPNEAEWIEFTVSRINYLPPDAFSRFHDLRRLTFYNCDLRQLSNEAFRGLNNLEWLVMSNTKIETARAKLFRHLTNLKRLTLDGAGLVYIEPELFTIFSKLETLSLRDNDLDCLPIEVLGSLTSLKTIQIGKNPWSCDCQSSLGKFLEERRIEHGPDDIRECNRRGMSNNTESFNELSRRTRNIYECMTILEYPDLPLPAIADNVNEVAPSFENYHGRFEWREIQATSFGSLDRLPDEIGWIQIFNVPIPTLGRYAFFRFGNTLRSIELTKCEMMIIEREAFAGLYKLERLSLIGNRFMSLGQDWFRDLVRLTDLVLRYNEIESFEENALSHLVALRRLDLRGNRLKCLPQHYIRGLVSLKRLEATDNQFNCDCRNDLENYLARMRIGYEISSGQCHFSDQDATLINRQHQTSWNSSATSSANGKVRWSWAHEVHRPDKPILIRPTTWRPEYHSQGPPATTRRPSSIVPHRPSTGGCHIVRQQHAAESCICTRASLVDLSNVPEILDSIVYSGSIIPTIHNDAFRKFGRYLRRLEFRECAIQSIERRAFYGLPILETLVIRGNDLDVVRSEWFEDIRNLRKLDLSRNGITRISNGVFDKLPYLVQLDVSDNRFNCIGIEHLESLRYLRQLEISGNPWTCLCITKLAQLMNERRISCNCNPEALIVERNEGGWGCHGDNGVTNIPTTGIVPRPTSPITTAAPSTITSSPYSTPLPSWKTISTGTCYHTDEKITAEASGQAWYHCSDGDLSLLLKIPSYTRKIEIIDSYVPHLPPMAFARFENLTELVLRNCTLRDVDPQAFAGLGRLEKLTLRDNRFAIVKYGWFRETKNLIWLDMSDNYLAEIETGAFEGLDRLEYLNLEGNAFQCIYTSCFVGLPRMTTLEFGRNPLKWRCWQELRQFLEIRAIGYTYYKCPHDGKDLVRNLLKGDEKPQAERSSNSASRFIDKSLHFTISATLLLIVGSEFNSM